MSRRTRPTLDLAAPELHLNRELSALAFQERVLAHAADPEVPLLDRLRFLGICSTNLDEFFEIRVSGLRQQIAYGVEQPGADGLSPRAALAAVTARARRLVAAQYALLNDELLPALREQGIAIRLLDEWTAPQQRWVERFFTEQVAPVLTPIGLDPAHPFPRVLNKSLNVIVSVQGGDAYGRDSGLAVVPVPRTLPRLLRLPADLSGSATEFVLLGSVVRAHVDRLFPGMRVTGCHQFRVTRNSDLWVDEEETEDLLAALKGELPNRNYSEAVRLEVGADCPDEVAQDLLARTALGADGLFRCDGPVNLHRLAALHELVDRPDLRTPLFVPGVPRRLAGDVDLFTVLRRGDVLLHHPYESFAPIVDLARQAARDPKVVAIKQTLYRTGADSPLGAALIDAARAGKEVTAVIELRARFDEAANIDLATRLSEVGAAVTYGVVHSKCHAKLLLIVRREAGGLRRYVHVGTGNYHPGTARAYTDLSLLSADAALGEDVHRVFQQLTGLGRAAELSKLLQAPFTLGPTLHELIECEVAAARAGRPCGIRARMNALSEPGLIRALYRASGAGVPIDLVVRGICCLRPGVPGVSETIRVRSIVGRFLEHSRVFHFVAGGRDLTYISSADWMSRNIFRRIETAAPIENERLRRRVLSEALDLPLQDDRGAWALGSDGTWTRVARRGRLARSSQATLLERLAAKPPPPGRAVRAGRPRRAARRRR